MQDSLYEPGILQQCAHNAAVDKVDGGASVQFKLLIGRQLS